MRDNWDKLDIIAKLLSGVVLVVIALAIEYGTEKIATSLHKGELVEKLIDDLTELNDKQDIALIALDYAVKKEECNNRCYVFFKCECNTESDMVVEIATQILRKRMKETINSNDKYDFTRDKAFIIIHTRDPEAEILEEAAEFLEVAIRETEGAPNQTYRIATKILEAKNPSKAATIVRNLQEEFQNNIEKDNDLKSNLRSEPLVDQQIQKEIPDKTEKLSNFLKHVIYLQFSSKVDKEFAEGLRHYLENEGYFVPGVENVNDKYDNQIRYFNIEDENLAKKVQKECNKYSKLHNWNIDFNLIDLSKSNFSAKKGQIEIWLSQILRLRSKSKNISEKEILEKIKNNNFNYPYPKEKIIGNYSPTFIEKKFIDAEVVIETNYNLMWQKLNSKQKLSWFEAKNLIQTMNNNSYGGFTNWRLPTVEEMTLLFSSKKFDGKYIYELFDNEKDDFWTIDTYKSGRAWQIEFDDGKVDDEKFDDKNYVRAVRSIEPNLN